MINGRFIVPRRRTAIEPRLHGERRQRHQGVRDFRRRRVLRRRQRRLHRQRGERRQGHQPGHAAGPEPEPDAHSRAAHLYASTRRRHSRRFSRPGSTTTRRPSSSRSHYNGVAVTYTVGATTVTDSRHPTNSFPATMAGLTADVHRHVERRHLHLRQTAATTRSPPSSPTRTSFFVDVINGVTYYIDQTAENRSRRFPIFPRRRSTPSSRPTATPI